MINGVGADDHGYGLRENASNIPVQLESMNVSHYRSRRFQTSAEST